MTTQTDRRESVPHGVTVVVPTYGRTAHLLNCLRDLVAQTYRPLEVLVVDQAASYGGEAYQFACEHTDIVRYDVVSFRGLPQARNYGWQNARYDAIVFVDDDIRCAPNLVAQHMRALQLPGVGVVAGGVDEPHRASESNTPTGTFNRWTAREYGGFSADFEGYVQHAKGCNYSAWRHVIREAGGTDEALSLAASMYEDLDFCLRVTRAGYRVYFSGQARLTHLAAETGGCRVQDPVRQVWGLSRNRTVLIRRHLNWYQQGIALAYQVTQAAGFTKMYRRPGVFLAGLSGIYDGWFRVSRDPLCSEYATDRSKQAENRI